MKKFLRCGYCIMSLTIIFSCMMVVSGVAVERPPASARTLSTLEVAYDHATGLISIQAHDTPLDAVLQELSKKVPFRIDALQKELLNEQITVELKHLSLEQALRKLLERFNSIFLYSSATDPLIRVILLSRKAIVPIEASTEPATVKEGEQAVEALPETLHDKDIPSIADAIAVLKGSAPDEAVTVLENWLQGHDPELRMFAADQLGEAGGDKAIQALSPLLTEDDPRIRQLAANTLARIGGDNARQSLIAAFLEGDDGLKQAALIAIASHGDEMSQEVLAGQLAGGQAARGQTAREVIVDSLRQHVNPVKPY